MVSLDFLSLFEADKKNPPTKPLELRDGKVHGEDPCSLSSYSRPVRAYFPQRNRTKRSCHSLGLGEIRSSHDFVISGIIPIFHVIH